jgi:hypothetical protein
MANTPAPHFELWIDGKVVGKTESTSPGQEAFLTESLRGLKGTEASIIRVSITDVSTTRITLRTFTATAQGWQEC